MFISVLVARKAFPLLPFVNSTMYLECLDQRKGQGSPRRKFQEQSYSMFEAGYQTLHRPSPVMYGLVNAMRSAPVLHEKVDVVDDPWPIPHVVITNEDASWGQQVPIEA